MRTLPAQPNKTSNFIGQWSNDDASDPHFRAGGATSSPPVADAPRCRGGPPAEPPAPRGSLEIVGLPSPSGGLVVPIERLPFHQSPGRWHFRCPSCGKLKGILVDVGADTLQAPLHVLQIGWVCRTCAGLPRSRAWPLTLTSGWTTLLKADDENRRPGEKKRATGAGAGSGRRRRSPRPRRWMARRSSGWPDL